MEQFDDVPHCRGCQDHLGIFDHEPGHVDDGVWMLLNDVLSGGDVSDTRLEGLSKLSPVEGSLNSGLKSLHLLRFVQFFTRF